MLWDEAALVVERLNTAEVTRAALLQMAVSSMFSKEAAKEFKKVTKSLSDG